MPSDLSSELSSFQWVGIFVISLLIRVLVGLHGHSGRGVPPMYGDFEAQRHWMELTKHLPLSDWYRNTSENDLLYWGLDYPPLTAYVSWMFAEAAALLGYGPSVEWIESRGMEDESTRFFMRMTVLICDACLFIPVVILCINRIWAFRARPNASGGRTLRFTFATLCLLSPGLLLIDHGHFQYNGVCIGLALIGAYFVTAERPAVFESLLASTWPEVAGSVLFCLSLNFKQMSLYYAPVFFFALLKRCLQQPSLLRGLGKLSLIGGTVVLSFALLWMPFCLRAAYNDGEDCASSLLHVLSRQFPFGRGIFEDKVSNLWYALSVIIDVRRRLSQETLLRLALLSTLATLSPVAVFLLRTPRAALSMPRMCLCLAVSALSFFLCSFQVHEKSILLAAVPSSLLFVHDAQLSRWVQVLATFSMYPLLKRDGLSLAYWACILLFVALSELAILLLKTNASTDAIDKQSPYSLLRKCASWLLPLSYIGMMTLHVAEATITPPTRFPDLFPALFALFGFANFVFVYLVHVVWLFASDSDLSIASDSHQKAAAKKSQ